MNNIINFVCFQIGWFSAVLTAAEGVPWIGVLIIGFTVSVHLFRSVKPREESILIVLIAFLGGAFDSIFVFLDWIYYTSGHIHQNLTTYWILAMWASFATTLRLSMSWLRGYKILSVIFGFFGGPLTYFGGYKLGAIEFMNFEAAMIGLAFGWAIIIPVLFYMADNIVDPYKKEINRVCC